MAGSFYASVFMSIFLRPKWRKKLRSLEANGGELCQVIGIKILVLQADSVNGLRLDLRPFEPVSRDFRGLTDSYPV